MKFTILCDERPECTECPFYQETLNPTDKESTYEIIEHCMLTGIQSADKPESSCPLTVVNTLFDTDLKVEEK